MTPVFEKNPSFLILKCCCCFVQRRVVYEAVLASKPDLAWGNSITPPRRFHPLLARLPRNFQGSQPLCTFLPTFLHPPHSTAKLWVMFPPESISCYVVLNHLFLKRILYMKDLERSSRRQVPNNDHSQWRVGALTLWICFSSPVIFIQVFSHD